ncbi:MAG: hypothetical protein ACRDJN_28715 [Chloroflexota bacterium]
MPGSYTATGTSRDSARVDDVPLPSTDPDSDRHTRRVARPQIVANRHDRKKSVKISLIHQRKSPKTGRWEDSPAFSLVTVKAGEEVRLHLDASQTWHLYHTLRDLYRIGPENIPVGEKKLLVLEPDSTYILQGKAREVVMYVEQHGPQLWDVIDQMKPDLLDVAAIHKLHETRRKVVAEFRAHMERRDWSEGDWQRFFEANTWIFGHSLAYRFLNPIQPQPTYGGVTVSGTGGQRGDILLASEAAVRFTVLIEINTATTFPRVNCCGSAGMTPIWRRGGHGRGRVAAGGEDVAGVPPAVRAAVRAQGSAPAQWPVPAGPAGAAD